MKHHLCILLLALAVAACAPTTAKLYYKQGAQLPLTQQDYDACKIASLREIPQAMVSEYDPGFSNPGTLSCETRGAATAAGISRTDCRQIGAYHVPPSVRSYDSNQGLRDRYITNCMGQKGYSLMTFPVCENAQAGYNPLTAAPPLGSVHCVQPNAPQLQE